MQHCIKAYSLKVSLTRMLKTFTQKERWNGWISKYIRLFFILHKEQVEALPWPQPTTAVNTLMPVNKGKLTKPCSASVSFSKVKLCFYSTHTMSRGPNVRFPLSLTLDFIFLIFLLSSTDFPPHIRKWWYLEMYNRLNQIKSSLCFWNANRLSCKFMFELPASW